MNKSKFIEFSFSKPFSIYFSIRSWPIIWLMFQLPALVSFSLFSNSVCKIANQPIWIQKIVKNLKCRIENSQQLLLSEKLLGKKQNAKNGQKAAIQYPNTNCVGFFFLIFWCSFPFDFGNLKFSGDHPRSIANASLLAAI